MSRQESHTGRGILVGSAVEVATLALTGAVAMSEQPKGSNGLVTDQSLGWPPFAVFAAGTAGALWAAIETGKSTPAGQSRTRTASRAARRSGRR